MPPLLKKFEVYCNSRRNVVLGRYHFHARAQQPGESITTFLAALRSLVVTCEFPDPDNMIRDRLVIGMAGRDTQRAFLRQAGLTLPAAVDIVLSTPTRPRRSHPRSAIIPWLRRKRSRACEQWRNSATNLGSWIILRTTPGVVYHFWTEGPQLSRPTSHAVGGSSPGVFLRCGIYPVGAPRCGRRAGSAACGRHMVDRQ